MADRIQARAIRRCGELLKQVEAGRGENNQYEQVKRDSTGPFQTRKSVAASAGLSERQHKTALRVASIPKEQREALIESDDPPTVTQLADLGKQSKPKPLHDLEGIEPPLWTRFHSWIADC